jgi:hypothetical protein
MGRTVTQDIQRLGVFGGDQPDFSVLSNGGIQIDQFIIDFHGHAAARQAVGYAFGDFGPTGGIVKSLYVAVRKCYVYHYNFTVIIDCAIAWLPF